MKTLSIDIETYSDVDLRKCGVYKYAESPGFEVLLFGYAFDGGEVQVADLSRGDEIPPEIINALTDDAVTKWAFNAAFERICLSRFLGYPPGEYLSPESWRCSMVWAATLGLPLSLEGVGSVLGLEKQKLNEGKDLIRYFCVPCTPTKTNGGRTRNKPFHAPDKWDMFKKYNKRDVETEMGIQKRLDNFPVPDSVWDEYHIDQEINDRGVKLDMDLVHRAIDMDSLSREELISSMKKITELENPNSVMQMRQWLSDNGLETESLDKKAVNELIKDAPENLANVLTLRKQLAKSSVKKYQAMKNTVCSDGRARGMFFFNGANRTGRWCLTGDHEVLTKNGWERLDSWNGGSIACWNPHNEIVSFQKANALCFDYSGPMYTYTDARIDQCSTPDHKMRAKKRYDLEWQDMTVEEMSKGRPCIPMTGCKNYRCCADPAWLRVLIMTQADGYYTEEGVLRYHFKKPRKIERCKMLLRKAEIAFQERSYAGGVTVIEVPSRCVPLWLRQFTDKTFGFWLFDENPDIFFDELPHWDGYYPAPNSIQYSTINKRNADIVQALAHMSGRTAVIHEKKPGKSNWSLSYVVDIWQKPTNSHEIKAKPSYTRENVKS